MNDTYLKEWMEKTDRRLDALEGVKAAPAPALAPKVKSSSYPRWIYRREPVTGEVQAQLIKTEAEMPEEGSYSDSPAKLDEAEEFEAVVAPSLEPEAEPEPEIEAVEEESIVPDMTEEMEFVAIPDDWRTMHHSSRIKLAKSLPGGDDVVSNDDAIALIELELENRGNTD